MADTKISVQTEKPAVASYDTFDVNNGKDGLSREAYKAATFHATSDTSGDARFSEKADLLGSNASELNAVDAADENSSEKKVESMDR